MIRRTAHRGDVLAALSAPVLVVAVLAGLLSVRPVDGALTARGATPMLAALHTSHEVVTALQDERLAALPAVADAVRSTQVRPGASTTGLPAAAPGPSATRQPSESTVQARAATDLAVTRLEQTLGGVPLERLGTGVEAAVVAARATLGQLPQLRRQVDAELVSPAVVLGGYAEIIDSVVTLPADVAGGLADRRLAAVLTARTTVTALHEDYTETPVVGIALAAARSADHERELSALLPVLRPARERARAAVRALDLGEDARLLSPVSGAPGNQADALRSVMTALDREADRRAGEAADAALRVHAVTVGVALAGLAVTMVSALRVRRRTVDPRQLSEASVLPPPEAVHVPQRSEVAPVAPAAGTAHVLPIAETAQALLTSDSADPVPGALTDSGNDSAVIVRRRDLRPPKRAPWWSRRRRAGTAGSGRPVAVGSPGVSGPTASAARPEPSPVASPVQPVGHFARDDAAPATGPAPRPGRSPDASRRSRRRVEPHGGHAPDGPPGSSGQMHGGAYEPIPDSPPMHVADPTPHGLPVLASPTRPAVPTQARRPVGSETDLSWAKSAVITTFTPQPTSGTPDDEVTTLLAQRADIAQQALSELSQLSSFRPTGPAGRGAGVPDPAAADDVPVPAAVDVPGVGQRTERDAGQVRSLLSSFATGSRRTDGRPSPTQGAS